MKLGQAQKIANTQLDWLRQRKQELTQLLKEGPAAGSSYDRVELSKALSAVEEEYEQTSAIAQQLSAWSMNIQNAEAARQQGEAIAEQAEQFMKILEVFRRIAKGDHVPPVDENKLIEYSMEMYMAAKNMALMNRNAEAEDHDSLWGDEEPEETPVDPAELANNTEVGNPVPPVRSSDLPELSADGG